MGSIHRLWPVACAVALFAVLGQADAGEDEIAWNTDIAKSMNQAARSGNPLFVDLWAIWCKPCKEMDETTYRIPEIVETMGAFVPLKIDHDVHESFVERHRVEALPTVLILDGKGREIARMLGMIEPEEMLSTMKIVAEGFPDYLESVERLDDPAAAEMVGSLLLRVGNPEEAVALMRKAVKAQKKADPAARRRTELLLAEAQLASGKLGPAMASFEKLSESAENKEVAGRALQGLVKAQREKGDAAAAEASLERLRREFPELAAAMSYIE